MSNCRWQRAARQFARAATGACPSGNTQQSRFCTGRLDRLGSRKLRASDTNVATIGGNGLEFGWRPSSEIGWRTVEALPPTGKYLKPERADGLLGAIGDSALVDFCGFGGRALHVAPSLINEWRHLLPTDLQWRRDRITDPVSGIVDLARVRTVCISPIINLAILDRGAAGAPIGRGIYIPPTALFMSGD